MINLLIYYYYFFWDYHRDTDSFRQKFSAYTATTGILLINILTIWNFSSSFFDVPHLGSFMAFNKGYLTNKLMAFLVVLPLFLIVFIYYRFNSKKVDALIYQFDNEDEVSRTRNRMKFWIYFLGSVILLFCSFVIR